MFCSSCGSEIFPESNFCPKCGKQIGETSIIRQLKRRSRWWFLLPILFHIIGGIIAYFVVKDDDPKLAKNCLYLGIILIAIQLAFVAAFWIPLTTMPYVDWEDKFISQV